MKSKLFFEIYSLQGTAVKDRGISTLQISRPRIENLTKYFKKISKRILIFYLFRTENNNIVGNYAFQNSEMEIIDETGQNLGKKISD